MICKVVVNAESGHYTELDLDSLLKNLGCVDTEVETIDSSSQWNAEGYDTVIVCGGDGTLKHAINNCKSQKIVYAPCGTLNEASRTESVITSVGKINGECFSYVCAAGSFTEIGYSAKNKNKQKFKALAYLPQVLANYRSHEINAEINLDGKRFDGCYTLIMILKSHRCFGFDFNKCYRKNKGLYLLAVKSKGKDSLLNRAKMFSTFFRIFFCGVNTPTVAKNWLLLPFENLQITLDKDRDFCLDGEKCVFGGKLDVCELPLDREITVVQTPFCKQKRNKKFTK